MSAEANGVHHSEAQSTSRLAHGISIAALVIAKMRFLGPMIIIYLVGYLGVTVLAGFAKKFMALKVIGSFNVGFALIAGNYILSWVLALIYVYVASAILDPLIEQAVAPVTSGRGQR
jgi:uncharacterized membrane protein (DUF485 family)